jgi:hypothetical protein
MAAYPTFVAPASCQLEITEVTGSNGTDAGVDLKGVEWSIEQVLIAGERYAASPSDVHIDRNGTLIIGKSLADKVLPGQCTIVIRARSLCVANSAGDHASARFKVLVNHPGNPI